MRRIPYALALVTLFSSLFLPFVSAAGLKQTNRRTVVTRAEKRRTGPLRARTSSMPCPPLTGSAPSSNEFYTQTNSATGAVLLPDEYSGYVLLTWTYPATDIGSAVDTCAGYSDDDEAYSFEVYFDTSACQWTCIEYEAVLSDVSSPEFESDTDVSVAYVYQFG